MSATRDPSQKSNFVYTNLYTLYQKGKASASATQHTPGLTKVIKKDAETSATPIPATIRPYRPIELLAKRQEKLNSFHSTDHAIDSLKKNLQDLNELHLRLKFMLSELEDLTRDDS
jgi:hypothetical protein